MGCFGINSAFNNTHRRFGRQLRLVLPHRRSCVHMVVFSSVLHAKLRWHFLLSCAAIDKSGWMDRWKNLFSEFFSWATFGKEVWEWDSSVYLFFITEMRVGSANIRKIAGTARQGMDTPDSLFFFLSPGGEDERGYRFDAWLGLVCAYGHT